MLQLRKGARDAKVGRIWSYGTLLDDPLSNIGAAHLRFFEFLRICRGHNGCAGRDDLDNERFERWKRPLSPMLGNYDGPIRNKSCTDAWVAHSFQHHFGSPC